jgi:4-alpha-glucanotransferase
MIVVRCHGVDLNSLYSDTDSGVGDLVALKQEMLALRTVGHDLLKMT